MDQQQKLLLEVAAKQREFAYAPYSRFRVGAALLAQSGRIYGGSNVENASFGATNCAERTAFFTAVAAGEREFTAIAIAGGKANEAAKDFCAPCGVCRQVMREFCRDDFQIILAKPDAVRVYTLKELLPESFSPDNLNGQE